MSALLRAIRLLVVVATTAETSTLPACGSMGMKYFVDPVAFWSA